MSVIPSSGTSRGSDGQPRLLHSVCFISLRTNVLLIATNRDSAGWNGVISLDIRPSYRLIRP